MGEEKSAFISEWWRFNLGAIISSVELLQFNEREVEEEEKEGEEEIWEPEVDCDWTRDSAGEEGPNETVDVIVCLSLDETDSID